MRLEGKTAIITGAASGLQGEVMGYGGATARIFSKEGANVIIADLKDEIGEKTASQIRDGGGSAKYVHLDVTREHDWINAIAVVTSEFGELNILVNNAGTNIRKSPELYSLEEWNFIMNTNLTSAFLCSKEAFMHMKNNKNGGKIINIGSMLSIFGGEYAAVYAASKGGIVQLTKSLAAAWASYEIQVNAILPGWITTDLTAGMREKFPDLVEAIDKRILSKRWGNPEDLAGTAVFLASSASDYINGIVLPVDGGYSISIK